MQVFILTNDKHLWLLRGFCHLFNTFWGENVTVVGFNPPPFSLPLNFTFYSLGRENGPVSQWSNYLIRLLDLVQGTHFILFLEDFWLTGKVDVDCIDILSSWIPPDALRVDLWKDRQAKRQARDIDTIGDYIIVETPPHTPYQMSLQAAIWNRDLLSQVLIPNETPWQVEIDGSKRLAHRPDLRVFGTRNCPVPYVPVNQKGTFNPERIPPKHFAYLHRKGWLDGR